MSVWEQLRTTAVQGSARRPPDRARWLADLDDLAVGLAADDAEAVLQAAALLTVARRGGTGARFVPPADDPVPGDPRPVVPLEVFDLLSEPRAEYEVALDEALAQARQRDLRLPAALAPALLDRAVRRPSTGADVVAGLGERAHWLAARNPAWAMLTDRSHDLPPAAGTPGDTGSGAQTDEKIAALDETPWRVGTAEVRVRWLGRLHRHDPAAAYPYLAAALGGDREPIQLRQAIIGILARTGSPDQVQPVGEEELLEACLDSRSQDVRRAAAQALGSWPSAAFTARMQTRVADWVQVEGVGSSRRLAVSVPTAIGSDAVRDGLGGGRRPAAGADDSLLLTEVVQATPLSFWGRFGPPGEVLQLIARCSHAQPLRAGLLGRVLREPGPEAVRWADELLAAPGLDASALAEACSPAVRNAHGLHLLDHAQGLRAAAALRWFERVPFPLPEEVCQAAVAAVLRLSQTREGVSLVRGLARRIGSEQPPDWHRQLETAAATLTGLAMTDVLAAAELHRRRRRVRELLENAATAGWVHQPPRDEPPRHEPPRHAPSDAPEGATS